MPDIPRSHRRVWEGKASARRLSDNFRFYVSIPYRRARKLYIKAHPYCEVCKDAHGLMHPVQQIEHLIPLNSGGSGLDFDNWMSVCKYHADVKNALEAQAGGSVIKADGAKGAKVPQDRGACIDLLRPYRKGENIYTHDVEQP